MTKSIADRKKDMNIKKWWRYHEHYVWYAVSIILSLFLLWMSTWEGGFSGGENILCGIATGIISGDVLYIMSNRRTAVLYRIEEEKPKKKDDTIEKFKELGIQNSSVSTDMYHASRYKKLTSPEKCENVFEEVIKPAYVYFQHSLLELCNITYLSPNERKTYESDLKKIENQIQRVSEKKLYTNADEIYNIRTSLMDFQSMLHYKYFKKYMPLNYPVPTDFENEQRKYQEKKDEFHKSAV